MAALRRVLLPAVQSFAIVLTLAALPGCLAPNRIVYSPEAAVTASIEGFANIRTYADSQPSPSTEDLWLPVTTKKQLDYLVMSGGGAAGAFSVGALKAWSDKGGRPSFDIVSGVSTGALIAPFAFLGSEYDQMLGELYTSGVAKDLVDVDFLPKALLGPSLLKQEPLRKMVEKYLTSTVLARIAEEHRKGRRLWVLTSNLDSQRAVIWNMGEIAGSGRPDALRLFQDVIIASASIPGVFPAVMIKVRSGGQTFEEMHSDGGSASQILAIPEGRMINQGKENWLRGRKLNMYVLVNNSLNPEFEMTTNNTFTVMARASSTLIKSQTRAALIATYAYAKKTRINLKIGSIDLDLHYDQTDPFNTNYMRAAYNLGYVKMEKDILWESALQFGVQRAAIP